MNDIKNNKNSNNSIIFSLFVNYFKPSTFVRSIDDIDLAFLKENGIKHIFCDLDNTLVPHYTKFPKKISIKILKSLNDRYWRICTMHSASGYAHGCTNYIL